MTPAAGALGTSGEPSSKPHIGVCICTYKRPVLLQRLLESLARQKTGDAFTFSIVVADNDAARSAEAQVTALSRTLAQKITYCSEPTKNIALVRNKAIEHADGDYIAFIDDDEFAVEEWLSEMLKTCQRLSVAGVLGPVRPHFDEPPPSWILKGRFCERPEHPTGTVMEGSKCRTGNVLFRRSILDGVAGPFRKEFGTGGEDVDFFQRMNQRGCVFVWCNEGIAYESVPPSRWTRSYMLKRALLRGRSNVRMRGVRSKQILTSFVAAPTYAIILPVTLILGQHVFMKYLIRFCDHAGRMLALVGLNPVAERPIT